MEDKSTIDTNFKKRKGGLATQYIVNIAIMSALLTSLKFALSFVPNVEVVTLLILVFASSFGFALTLPAVLIFCAIEMAIYGIGSWVLLYFIYWPLLAIVASVLLKRQNLIVAVLLSIFMSILFGVLSACTDTLIVALNLTTGELSHYFVAYYLKGLYYDIVHVVSNMAIVCFLYLPLVAILKRIKLQKRF